MDGWILIHKSIEKKGYYSDSEYVHLWVHLLLQANWEEKEFLWNGKIQKLLPGQFITGRKKLAQQTGINEYKIERILKLFKNEQQIAQQTTRKYRLITILNWDKYQKRTTERTPGAQQMHTAKELKELNTYRKSPETKETVSSGEQSQLFKVEPEPAVFTPSASSAPPKNKREAFLKMVTWAETRRGFKFMNYPKQFKALSEAVRHGIPPAKVYERWELFEKDKFWIEKGFDFMDVVISFNKKQ